MDIKPKQLYVTYLDREGPYIKVWGQTDRAMPVFIEKSLKEVTPEFEQGLYLPPPEVFQVGLLCCAKFKDGCFYRARITNVTYIPQGMVEVVFVDYGNMDMIPCSNIRTMSNVSVHLISIPPQAKCFILAGISMPVFDPNTFEAIASELRYLEFEIAPVLEVKPYLIIRLLSLKQDISVNLVNSGLVISVPLQTQQLTLQQMFSQPVGPKVMPQPMFPRGPPGPPEEPTLLSFKVMPLQEGTEHEVYVSYVSDGPCLFSVQLQKLETVLKRLMTEINSIELAPLDEYPLPGTVCLAQSTEDGYICRAVITSMVDGQYKVFYVDFGNTEILEIEKLFQIPFKYVIPKVMATRFALTGLESATVSIEMKCAFKDFVNNKLLHMRIRSTAKSGLPLCDLWDESGVQALDVIRSSALLAYPEPLSLMRGFSQEVKVCFADSCNKFFVQLKSKENDLEKLMNVMQEICPTRPLLTQEQIKTGTPCYAQFATDKLWYRGIIINNHKLRYVDYGNEDDIDLSCIREPVSEHIFALRPQAIECCLNGYQNLEPDEQRDKLLEDLILEREFMMKVVESQGNRTLVELFDEAHYNVASLLLDRIATANAQVSPLLIQDDSRIEQRKRSPPQGYREKRPFREMTEQSNERENWRRGNSPRVNQHWEKQDSAEKTDFRQKASNTGYNSSDSQCSGVAPPEKNLYHRGPKRVEGPRGRNFDNGSGDWNKFESGDNRGGFSKGGSQRNDDQRGGRTSYEKRDNIRRQPRGPDSGRNNNEEYHKKTWFDNNKGNDDSKGFDNSYRQKRTEYKRDGSWSDSSDRGGRKGGGTRNTNNRQYNNEERGRGFQKSTPPKVAPSNDLNTEENWEETTATNTSKDIQSLEEYVFASNTDRFKLRSDVIGQTELVSISWFYNPTHFFVQLQTCKIQFTDMMKEIQARYKQRKQIFPEVGAPVIVQFPDDKVLYRAEVLCLDGNRYRVRYVDYGNTGLVDIVYAIESKYMELPEQAIPCGLRRILPPAEAWGSPDTYSMYFSKNEYSCTFLFALEDRCCVDLVHDSKDLSTLLVEGQLAVSDAPIETNLQDFDMNLLVGQQLVAFLKEVVSMSDIKLEIEPNLVVNAVMHNLAQATETYEDDLKKWTGQFVIIYVDIVTDDKLEITIYDLNGQKLTFLHPDKGAYDAVDILCALPIYTRSIHGYVCYATITAIYVQPSKYEHSVNQLLDSMHNTYNGKTPQETVIPIEGEIYAVLSADGNWYRARVTDVQADDVTVTFVDYGNSETIPNLSLRNLSPELFQPHMLAVEITITENAEKYLDAEVGVNIVAGDSGWTGTVIGSEIAKEEEITENIVIEEKVVSEKDEIQPNTSTVNNQDGYPRVDVTLSHIDSPSEFYLQLTYDLDLINSLQAELQNRIPDLPNLQNPTPGILCAAPYSVQGEWYRAQVLDADDDITTVRFVDYGNTDVIDNKTTSIKTLPADMLSLEFHSRLCSLNINSLSPEWSTTAIEKFESLVANKTLQAEIIQQEDKTTYVELFANGISVSETLKSEGLAGNLQLETANNSTGFISHLNSLSEFWVQMESSVPDLEWVADQLANAESFPVLQDLTPGSLCAAVFPADESWYRARILSNTVAGIEVIFIDYGNSCSCSSLRELPEDLVMSPALAMKCSLQKPNGLLQWSPLTTEKFRELSADGATVFTINVLTPGETSIIQMTLDGRDISGDFMPETRDCYISFIVDLDNFWVQFADHMEKIDSMADLMSNAESWVEVENPMEGDLLAALFNEDGVWYRAKIIGKENDGFKVFFVDYGNEATTGSFRKLVCDAEKEEPLCANFRMDVLPRTKWADDANEKFVDLHADGATMFQLEMVSDSTARLYLNGEDIRTSLGTVKCTPTTSAASSPKKSYPSSEKNINQEVTHNIILETETHDAVIDENLKASDNENVGAYQPEPAVIPQQQLELDGGDKHPAQSGDFLPKTRDSYIAFVVNLDNFWVQFADYTEKIDKMADLMLNAESWAQVENPKEGDLVAALFNDDGVWYRAKIIGKENDGFRVFFVDYGNEAVTDRIRKLVSDAEMEEPLCANFRLAVLPGTKWAEDAKEKFVDLHADGATMFQLEVVSDNIAQLYLNGEDIRTTLCTVKRTPTTSAANSPKKSYPASEVNINEEITHDVALETVTQHLEIKENVKDNDNGDIWDFQPEPAIIPQDQLELDGSNKHSAQSRAYPPDTRDCYISYAVDLDNCWVQFADHNEKIDKMADLMLNAEGWAVMENPKEGDLVAALFNEDGVWYRAKILGTENEGFRVLFVDYGNEAVTENIRKLVYDAEKEDPLCANYRLDVFPGTKWAEDAYQKFVDLHADGSTMFQLEVVSDSIARLYLNGEDICTTLGTVKCTASTSAANSPKKSHPCLEKDVIITHDIPHETATENKEIDDNNKVNKSEAAKITQEQLDDKFESPIYEANLVKEICDRVVGENGPTQEMTPENNMKNDSQQQSSVSSSSVDERYKSVDTDSDSAIGNQSFASPQIMDESSGDVFSSPRYEANLINEICDRIVESDVKKDKMEKVASDAINKEVKAVMKDGVLENSEVHSEEKNGV